MQYRGHDNQISRQKCRSSKLRCNHSLAFALLVTTALGTIIAAPAPVFAQAAEKTGRVAYNIPPLPLSQALVQFSKVTGIQLFFSADVARGISSRGASGSLTRTEALDKILAGSGLTYHFTNATTVTISNPAAAAAGAAAANGATTLAPIVVQAAKQNGFVSTDGNVASKSGIPLLETPQSVQVVTKAQLEVQKPQTVRQAIAYSAGVTTPDSPDNRLDNFLVRGFQIDQYYNGLKLQQGTWAVPKVDPFFLDSIEVLQGPASVLYGQGSPGGLLNMVGKKPTDEPLHEIQFQTGSHNRAQAAFDFSGPVNDDGTLLYRLTGLGRTTGTQVENQREERVEIAPSVTIKPDEDTKLTILGDYLNDPRGGFWSRLPATGTILPTSRGTYFPTDLFTGDKDFDRMRRQQQSIGYEFEHRFNDIWTIRQNVRFQHMSVDYAELQASALAADGHTLSRSAYTAQEQLNTLAIDNQAEADFDTGPAAHKAILGLDYQYKNWNNLTHYGAGPSLDLDNPDYTQAVKLPAIFQNASQRQQQFGLYAQDQLKLDNWALLLSARHDWASTDSDNYLKNVTTDQNDHAFTWRAGLTYLFDNGFAPYASYATSFNPTIGVSASGDPFKPTTGDQYEVGIKYQPTGYDSFITASLYDLTQQNYLTNTLTTPVVQTQVGEVRSRGGQISGVASINDELNLTASYAYLSNEILKASDGTAGNRIANLPANTASLWADYKFQDGTADGLGLGFGVRYIGSRYATNANTVKMPDHVVFDAAVNYDLGKLSNEMRGATFALNVSNLFDKHFISDCTAAGCVYGMRRTVFATLGYKW
ncbi:TonB-dependent siderophore receptor [Rhizobium sp. P44RR-XXIV]|uniref:TonB-dependent siderophore receptor n=1 Tax=Rhizobium sp. P44RR-XXIV TaxID=1921145 RepID=UPI0009870379|nr:TonB-dependent siderophore receptor [Rhizobium sp. P44RR-XXIV]TIX86930.1 TonB-dependent siderophore receptor [Rhizobium sp. P44RR-XXIV]